MRIKKKKELDYQFAVYAIVDCCFIYEWRNYFTKNSKNENDIWSMSADF